MNRWSPRYADGLTPPPPPVEPATPVPVPAAVPAADVETSEAAR